MVPVRRLLTLPALLLAGACTTLPSGPNVLVLPGTGKGFDAFRADEVECRQYAGGQVGGTTAADAANENAVRNAAIGTALGAAAGALIDGRGGAGVGAGMGLLMGSAVGAGTGERSGYALQRRYDFAYQQCMYAKGHRVPVSGNFVTSTPPPAYAPPPPPPPRGYPR